MSCSSSGGGERECMAGARMKMVLNGLWGWERTGMCKGASKDSSWAWGVSGDQGLKVLIVLAPVEQQRFWEEAHECGSRAVGPQQPDSLSVPSFSLTAPSS